MTPRSLALLSVGLALLLAACSGNMGGGAIPPVSNSGSGNMGNMGGSIPPQSMGSIPGGPIVPASPSAEARPLEASITVQANERRVLRLPEAADFGGKLCIGPAAETELSCTAATPTPSGEPSATPHPTPSPTPSTATTPGTILITPAPSSGLRMKLMAYPGSAPSREHDADDSATSPLVELDLNAPVELSIGGLHAFTLTLPREQASSEHHYALVLYDRDQRTSRGALLPHKQRLHAVAVARSAQLNERSLIFVDHPSPLKLIAKHHYTVVLYTDTVTATPRPPIPPPTEPPPSYSSPPYSAPSYSSSPPYSSMATPAAFSTPFVTYPNTYQTP